MQQLLPKWLHHTLFLRAMLGWSSWGHIIFTTRWAPAVHMPSSTIVDATNIDSTGNTVQLQHPWLSPQFRTLILGTTVPAAIVLLTFTYDWLSAIELPKALKKLLWTLASPFTGFLSLDDLEDEPGATYNPPLWKVRVIAILSAIQALAWAAFFCYVEVAGDMGIGQNAEAGVGFLSWVGFLSAFYVEEE